MDELWTAKERIHHCTAPRCREGGFKSPLSRAYACYGAAMPDSNAIAPFFLIVADQDRRVFTVEGPMTDDGAWNLAAGLARETGRNVQCGPTGPDRQGLAIAYQQSRGLGGAPPGSVVRPRR